MKLLVSIHDVAPPHEAASLALWQLCRARGVTPALLVVPNWHGCWPIERYPAFTARLRQQVADGAEVLLHGERHDEVGTRRGHWDNVRAFGKTDGEGEFLTLEERDARRCISRGIQVLTECGLEPTGFVAPAWLGRVSLKRALSTCGLRISEDATWVYLHERATRLRAPVTRWSARTRARAAISTVVAEARWRADRRAPLVRIALHPQDLASNDVRHSIERTLDHWLTDHHPWRYASL